MEKINTDYKQRIWKNEAKRCNMRKPWLSSLKLAERKNYNLRAVHESDFKNKKKWVRTLKTIHSTPTACYKAEEFYTIRKNGLYVAIPCSLEVTRSITFATDYKS